MGLYKDAAASQEWEELAKAALPFVAIARVYDPTRSYGGRAMACVYCGAVNPRGHHQLDCRGMAALALVNQALAQVGLAPITEGRNPYAAPALTGADDGAT